ncbi:ATP-dependent RNA helicase DDX6/DHH1 [Nematocida minor]|uniref:ATP-dependent RNA helicase DDX6/DHH1 n=1 Tax=Nematocida minor TaxID=1912983 RepID=UPI002220E95B|nr:ATP-dependent RNA helicase DDX6/DHH1 [Nematocida minor]KAI5190431.1 ATP-dependent RNA helicase DDX6/DHH1 [Nematocida minor]
MKNKEEKKIQPVPADIKKTAKDRAAGKSKHPHRTKEKEMSANHKQGEIIKIREKIDTLLEKIEKIEKSGAAEESAEKERAEKEREKAKEETPSVEFKPMENTKKRPRDLCSGDSAKSHKWTDYKLKKEVLLGIQKKGFSWPSPIQAASIPHSLKNQHIVARSKNGTGKTAAFIIPLLNKINPHWLSLQAMILVPTRELVLQTAKVCRELGEFLRLKIIPLYGGFGAKDDIIRLRGGAHIIIGTPGRVHDFLNQRIINLDRCTHLVCDEADKLLSADFKEVVYEITSLFPKRKQIEMYSATFPAMIQNYIDTYMPNAVKINLMKELTLSGVKQYYAYVKPINKLHCLKTILSKLSLLNQCFIFCNSIQTVERLAKRMTEFGSAAYYIHSKMKQEDRNLVFHNFTLKSECRILVSTDLVTRGIDVPSVNVVINFDLPKSTESYLHRIGRSGRFGTEGIAINMVTPDDVPKIREIEADLGIEIHPFSDNI